MEKEIKNKILQGEEYLYSENILDNLRLKNKIKCFEYNTSSKISPQKRQELIKSIINTKTDNFYINKKFNCNFCKNIFIGDNFYSSFNLTIIDENLVEFGDNIYIGPNCSFDTIDIPLDKEKRRQRLLSSRGIKIGNNVYFEGSIIISNGVKIGNNVIIKAGSLINKDIPDNTLVEGNPFKVIYSNISFNFKIYIHEMINNELKDENYIKSKKICDEFNNVKFENFEEINNKISKLFKSYNNLYLTQNAYILNGNHSSVGNTFYANYNFILIDNSNTFSAGNNVLFGPNCTVNTNIIEYNESKKEFILINL